MRLPKCQVFSTQFLATDDKGAGTARCVRRRELLTQELQMGGGKLDETKICVPL
jgi:hypothetical protein